MPGATTTVPGVSWAQPATESGAGINIAVSGTVPSPKIFEIAGATEGTNAILHRVVFAMYDDDMTPERFGGLLALTNGMLIQLVDKDDVVLVDYLPAGPIKSNADWFQLMGIDFQIRYSPRLGDKWEKEPSGLPDPHDHVDDDRNHLGPDMMLGTWDLTAATGGKGLRLLGGFKLRFVVRDDLTSIPFFGAVGQGTI